MYQKYRLFDESQTDRKPAFPEFIFNFLKQLFGSNNQPYFRKSFDFS